MKIEPRSFLSVHYFICRTVQFNNRGVLAQNADSSLVFAGPGLRSQGTAMWNAADGTAFDATTANLKGGRTLRGPGVSTSMHALLNSIFPSLSLHSLHHDK